IIHIVESYAAFLTFTAILYQDKAEAKIFLVCLLIVKQVFTLKWNNKCSNFILYRKFTCI
ncbi:hypothetical protein EOH30_22530, partial [Salmonella enterica]|nr:hypothetical protein [Salmonella enterica]